MLKKLEETLIVGIAKVLTSDDPLALKLVAIKTAFECQRQEISKMIKEEINRYAVRSSVSVALEDIINKLK